MVPKSCQTVIYIACMSPPGMSGGSQRMMTTTRCTQIPGEAVDWCVMAVHDTDASIGLENSCGAKQTGNPLRLGTVSDVTTCKVN